MKNFVKIVEIYCENDYADFYPDLCRIEIDKKLYLKIKECQKFAKNQSDFADAFVAIPANILVGDEECEKEEQFADWHEENGSFDTEHYYIDHEWIKVRCVNHSDAYFTDWFSIEELDKHFVQQD